MAKTNRELDLFGLVLELINPLLVMGLIGSLAFFLLDVGYRGRYDDQLRWTMFFFVFAIVLIVRIGLTIGNEKAVLYGLLLGGATFLVIMRYFQGIGVLLALGVIVVATIAAYLLTKDTTWVAGGQSARQSDEAILLSDPWQLLAPQRLGQRHRKWIIWFTLATLPIFGIGQSLMPMADTDRRRSAFWRITIYVASCLGLLLTTALINLRQYLKTRKLKLPPQLAARWLVTGAVLVVLALVIAALLPRPQSETPLFTFAAWHSPDRQANQIARQSKDAGDGQGQAGGDGRVQDKSTPSGKQGQHDPNAKDKSDDGRKGSGGKSESDQADSGSGDDSEKSDRPPSAKSLESVVSAVQSVIRWLVIVGVVVAAAFFILRLLANSQEWAAKWLQKLASLFGRKATPTTVAIVARSQAPSPPPAPFSAYANPFADGSAKHRDRAELVRYTFAALEAWARQQGQPREQSDTAYDFARNIGNATPPLGGPAIKLASLYSSLAYARKSESGSEREIAKAVWDVLESTPFVRHESTCQSASKN